jgi:hypothetical protein
VAPAAAQFKQVPQGGGGQEEEILHAQATVGGDQAAAQLGAMLAL